MGLVDIVVVAAIGVCFAYLKIKSMSTEAVEDEVVPTVGSNKKTRRLSSRQLMMVEMTNQNNDFSGTNPMPRRNNTGANLTPPSTGAFRQSGKKQHQTVVQNYEVARRCSGQQC